MRHYGCGEKRRLTQKIELLQRQEDGVSRLKRVILIGDHHQLPPVVKNMAFQKYSHLDQSLFTRFVRLGTPYVQLNAQVSTVYTDHLAFFGYSACCFEFCAPSGAGLLHSFRLSASPLLFGRVYTSLGECRI